MKNHYHDYRTARLIIDNIGTEISKMQNELVFISPDFIGSALDALGAQLQSLSEQLYFLEEIEDKKGEEEISSPS